MAPNRDPDTKNTHGVVLHKLNNSATLEAVAGNSPQHLTVRRCRVQETKVSGPAHLDLRVYPNGAWIWEKARHPSGKVREGWGDI